MNPAVLTVMACVVAPLLHNQDAPADAVSVTEPPLQRMLQVRRLK